MSERALVVIDGEHYPPVVARAIERLRGDRVQVAAALVAGGGEKLDHRRFDALDVPVVEGGEDPERFLAETIERLEVGSVIDISDEPVLDYRRRFRMASVALWRGVPYRGPGFRLDPPPRPKLARVPSLAVIGTGKRCGKTAIGGATARALEGAGMDPVVVAMGRGGPESPEVVESFESLNPALLLEWAAAGRHAASDYIEDALTARVKTVGAWRAGGGLAGAVEFTNFPEAVRKAHSLDPGVLVFEGSGSAIPPAHADASILVVPSSVDPEYLCGYLGVYRLLLADLVVVTMIGEPLPRTHLETVEGCIRSAPLNKPKVIRCVLRPHPIGEVSRKKVWLVTTAPPHAAETLTRELESRHDARVAGVFHSLADRAALAEQMKATPEVDAIVVELKAAAVDVVTRFAIDRSIEVVYMDNRPALEDGTDLSPYLEEVGSLARERFS